MPKIRLPMNQRRRLADPLGARKSSTDQRDKAAVIQIKDEPDDDDPITPAPSNPSNPDKLLRTLTWAKMETERLANLRKHGKEDYISSAGLDDHTAWKKRWELVYNVCMANAVSNVRLSLDSTCTSENHQSLKDAVFVVSHTVFGRWVDPVADVIGTYDNVASANEHAMVFFADEYTHLLPEDHGKEGRRGYGFRRLKEDQYDTGWNLNDDGCLSLIGQDGKQGEVKVKVLKQAVQCNPPALKYNPIQQAPTPFTYSEMNFW